MSPEQALSRPELVSILLGIIVGFSGRVLTLRADYRQYPTYPNGYLIHLTTGFVAAALGAVAWPALLSRNYVAVTFLTLAIQQFRDVRKIERDSLRDLEKTEYAPRGNAYIDGISKTFEARNYLALIAALTTTVITITEWAPALAARGAAGVFAGVFIFFFLKGFTKGKSLKHIAKIREGNLRFEGANLFVDDIYVMNVGLAATRERIQVEGLGVIIEPNSRAEAVLLGNFGQRQAIQHEVARLMGVERYMSIRRSFDDGRVALFLVPIRKEIASTIQVIGNVPVLESSKKIIK